MKAVLGIDTSNYTTSVALINSADGKLIATERRLLPVKEGERGIRQSDAVFHHTVALPQLLKKLFTGYSGALVAVSVSVKPSPAEGSYMPCFLAGVNAAQAIAAAMNIPLYETTHQTGHVLACLYGARRLDCLQKTFLCFHVSGGTTDALLITPERENLIAISCVGKSLDLKAGQAVDRIGVKMGFPFPAGKALNEIANGSTKTFCAHAKIIGHDCSLSGLENKALAMLSGGESREDTARFVFDYLANTLERMSRLLLEDYGDVPLFFAGGVMSNTIIKEQLTKQLGAVFCPPQFSTDNAIGTAIYGYLKWNNLNDLL